MVYTASKLIAIALAEVGYLEKKSNAQLDDKTANSGSKNYTKYARDLNKAGYYNGNKNGYAWCDVFVDWCFYQLCGKDAKKAEAMICQTGDYGAGCKYSAQYYKNKGRLHKTPEPGDQIFFYNSSKTSIAHTGIVYAVDDKYVYTVEGNTSSASGVVANGGAVEKKKYKRTYSRIYRYGRPKYDAEETIIQEEVKKMNIELRELKQGDTGDDVLALQILLKGRGCNGSMNKTLDGKFGNNTRGAVILFQRKHGLSQNGVADAATWNKLLGLE